MKFDKGDPSNVFLENCEDCGRAKLIHGTCNHGWVPKSHTDAPKEPADRTPRKGKGDEK